MLSEWDTGTTGVNQDCSRKTRTLDHLGLITRFSPDLVAIPWTSPDNFFFPVESVICTHRGSQALVPISWSCWNERILSIFSCLPGLFWFTTCGGKHSTVWCIVGWPSLFFKRNVVLCVSDPVLDCFWESWLYS